ncbi:MAG: nuclear transport factor 2 family protein [Dokdonella sp.]
MLRITLLLMSCLAVVACSRTPDEQRIRESIEQMQTAMQEKQPRDFMRTVADDFTGANGSVDREALHNLLRAQVIGNASIGVTLGPLQIDVQDQRATVRVTATFTGGNGRWIPQRGAVYAITSGWRKDDDEWVCVNAQWEQAL